MIKSPLETLPVSTAVATALLSNASVFLRPSLTTGLTPQTIAHWRAVSSLGVTAIISE